VTKHGKEFTQAGIEKNISKFIMQAVLKGNAVGMQVKTHLRNNL
jgi:hypothetical protein